jgi:ABC-type multidrug transport system ATPase subunit
VARRAEDDFPVHPTLSVAENLCDRIGVIHRAPSIALGTVAELNRRLISRGDLEGFSSSHRIRELTAP